MDFLDIGRLGWDDCFDQRFQEYRQKGYIAARVVACMNRQYRILCAAGEVPGVLSGKCLHALEQGSELPVTGDWVAAELKGETAYLHGLVERKTCFARKPAISGGRKIKHGVIQGGATERQALAANIDTVFIVCGLDGDWNAQRTERYLTAAAAGGIRPVILLNKSDLYKDPSAMLHEAARIAKDSPVHVLSAATGDGLEQLNGYIQAGATVAFLGSSGTGKSTLVNRLFGWDLLGTGEVNAVTGKGRHTTTRAELLLHESGCMLVDTPGIRELQLWCGDHDLEDAFADVAVLVGQCRFSDCSHRSEPGCAVRQAIEDGSLPLFRYESFRKLDDEVRLLAARRKQRDISLARREKYRAIRIDKPTTKL